MRIKGGVKNEYTKVYQQKTKNDEVETKITPYGRATFSAS